MQPEVLHNDISPTVNLKIITNLPRERFTAETMHIHWPTYRVKKKKQFSIWQHFLQPDPEAGGNYLVKTLETFKCSDESRKGWRV